MARHTTRAFGPLGVSPEEEDPRAIAPMAGTPASDVVSKEELNRQVALLLQRKRPELGVGEPGRPVNSPGIRRGWTVTDPPGVVVEELEGREALIRRDPLTRDPAPPAVQLQQAGSARASGLIPGGLTHEERRSDEEERIRRLALVQMRGY